jgi:hypothetical protein
VYVLVRDDSGSFRFEAEIPVAEPSIGADGAPFSSDFGFGQALALQGKELMVSHERADEIAGTMERRVYVYVRTRHGWSHRQTIPLGACNSGQWSIDLDAGTALLGTCVFERDRQGDYQLVAQLTADDGQPLDDLAGSDGKQTALDGRTLVIGVPSADGGTGAAYVFRRYASRWSQVARLAPDAAAGSSQFGAAVDLEGNLLAIGAPNTQGATLERPGVVHLYTRQGGTWELAQVLTNPLPHEGTVRKFGDSVAVDGGRVLVGTLPSPLATFDDFVPGAYLYERTASAFVPTNVLAVSWVTSVFLSGNTALAGTFQYRAEWWLGFDVPGSSCH